MSKERMEAGDEIRPVRADDVGVSVAENKDGVFELVLRIKRENGSWTPPYQMPLMLAVPMAHRLLHQFLLAAQEAGSGTPTDE